MPPEFFSEILVTQVKRAIKRAMYALSNARSIVHKGIVVAELQRLEVEALKAAKSLKLPLLLHF